MAMESHNYLIHYGKRGMKWGYSNGQSNGKRAADQSKNDGTKPEDPKKDDTTGKYENGLDKNKYTRVKLKSGKYVYNLRKEYKDFKKTESTKKRICQVPYSLLIVSEYVPTLALSKSG